jgi:exonuclease III
MQGRKFTWSNGIDQSTFVRHDRFLISTEWSQSYPVSIQIALTSTVSDHCPVLCTYETKFPLPNTFRFENY